MTEKGSKTLQYVAVAIGNLSFVTCGVVLGWTSPIIPKLLENNPIAPDNPLLRPITKDEGSWMGSLVPLGVMVGSIISGYLGDWYGRKRGLLMTIVPFIVGSILLGTARTIIQIYVGRFVLGLGVATALALIPMYAGEVSEVSIRGALGSFLQLFITFGFLFSYAVGPFVPYSIFCYLTIVVHLSFFISFMLMPESPYFLLSKGRETEATQALARFRGKTTNAVKKEIEELQAEIDEAFKIEASWKDTFLIKVNRKPIVLMCMILILQELTGIDVVLFYVEEIFHDAGAEDAVLSAIIIGVVQIVFSMVSPLFVDKSGRKILLIVSSIGCGIMSAALGVYFYMRSIDIDVSNMTWLPLTSLILFVASFCIGWGPLPWVIVGEMLPPGVKSKASSICVLSNCVTSFLTTKFTPLLEEAYGAHVGFWMYSVLCGVSVVFIAVSVPETKGKTLQQIQQEIGGFVSAGENNKTADVEKSSIKRNKDTFVDQDNVTSAAVAKTL